MIKRLNREAIASQYPNAHDPTCPKCGHVHTQWYDIWDNGMTSCGFTCKCGCTWERDEEMT